MKIMFLVAVLLLQDFVRFTESNLLSFDYLVKGDADIVLEKLKGAGQKLHDIFNIRNSQEMTAKMKLPHLGTWIKETINTEFQEKDPQKIFKQIIETEKHLKVSGVGCKQFKCKLSVDKVGKTYDSLIKDARRVSSESVLQTMKMLQFIRDGVKDSSKRDESLKKCIPIAEKLSKEYGSLEKRAGALQTDAYNAVMEIERDNLKINQKEKKDAIILGKLKGILHQAKRIEEERCNSKSMTDIGDILGMIGSFTNNLNKDFETALKAMSAASVSMKIIKTMALDIKEFWDDQVLLIKKISEKNTVIPGLEGIEGFEVNIAEIGLYWLAFGTVSVTADNMIVKRYGRLVQVKRRLSHKKTVGVRGKAGLQIDASISSHVFGVIYFKMSEGEKRQIALEGSDIIAASKVAIDKLNKNKLAACSCVFQTGECFGYHLFIGSGIEQNDCADKCMDRRVTSPSINAVSWDRREKRCFCKYGMAKINRLNVNYKSCYLKGEACPMEKGFCVLPNGGDQNSGVIKLNNVDGNTQQAQATCLALCRQRTGATGCEVIWHQGNRGCYVHTQTVARGNGVDRHMCWIFAKCTTPVPTLPACPIERGFCVLLNGGDQNSGVIKLNNVDGNTQQAQATCLSLCRQRLDATGCEVIWHQGNRGCYVHTKVVARGNGVDRHMCWVFSKCGGGHIPIQGPVSNQPVCPIERGFCVLPNGGDQNSGVIKLNNVDGNTQQAQATCLSLCRQLVDATGCEVIWHQGNRGCYVHTKAVARGNGVDRHMCWIFSKCGVCPIEKGFCVLPNGRDQNSGVIKLNNVDGNTQQAQATCLSLCRQRVDATGCEVIWHQGNRGCYVHTQAVARGNGVDRHMCWIFSKCTISIDVLSTVSPALKVMGQWNGFPMSNDVGKMYIGNVADDKFVPGIIITWENRAGRAAGYQWLGWEDRLFSNRKLAISFWIKFVGRVPTRSGNFGMKVYGKIYNDWVSKCQVNKWCFVDMVIVCAKSGDGNHVILIFDSITHKQVVRISQLKIQVLH